MKLFTCIAAAVFAWMIWSGSSVFAASDGSHLRAVNGSVTAREGQSYTKVSTVNGDVRIGRGASADEAETVNGSIDIDDDARLGRVSTVNGSLNVANGVAISGAASTVNGDVDLERARVGGDVTTVSGDIDLKGSEVTGGLRTVNGDIELAEGARVHGGITVKKNKGGWSWGEDDPVKVRICSTCVVDGELRFERPVELRVESGGKIGQVIGENVKRL